ncbi:ABC transporter ATP-binding protein [Microbacterium thalli]|uniref:ABC transporter ATP-binding protein n=1 Tax=Microbacterium thalli TaxID=3027921 RepID=A0ABT5SG93_9MICO|nr:ABC transporter ATP-binding protein [Microbacterium thalli]MDD7928659.1 ABC transporter ATP-binding protein [Microbacterium thalli]MDD7961246.1 ABC transporter ATP-binding protein [Microbacterium thalli]
MAATGSPRPATIEARGWGWRYATRRAWALRDTSFRIEAGERVLLLGASGSGKSTLLQGMAGVLGGADEGEQHGQLLVDGDAATATRGRTGLVLQDPDSQTILARVGDDIAFGCENLGVPRPEIWARVREARDAVGLDVPLDRSTSALSGGQKQRLALAGVVAMRPGAVLLDEPTANLDPAGVVDVRDAVARALDATGATLVVIEHRIEAWLPLVTRVIVVGAGGVVADGDPRTVLEQRGPELAAAGVWVPGIRPPFPPLPPAVGDTATRRDALVSGERLVVGRVAGAPVAGPLDVEVRRGEVLGIVGANGAGKSTLGLTLAGLIPALGGAVRAAPALAEGAALTPRARRRARRGANAAASPDDPATWTSTALLTRIGTVLQEPEHQILRPTVREELEVGPRALGLAEAEIASRVDELLERLRLAALAPANPYTLSGGEKRRLTVAATLAARPRVVVLDEPTYGQDARTWSELVAIIAALRDGIDDRGPLGVAAITHDGAVLEALAARRFELRTPAPPTETWK